MSGRRVGRRALIQIREEFSERDLTVLRAVHDYRLLNTRQIEFLVFSDHATPRTAARQCRRVLQRLTELRVLARLERRIGGVRAGSASFIYSLGAVGHRLLEANGTSRRREPSEAFVIHTLAVAQTALDVIDAQRRGLTELVARETEPDCWRRFQSANGPEIAKPDLFLATADADTERRWFVEVDLGTESGPAIRRKCHRYQRYWQSGIEQDRDGVFPKVLYVADTKRRAGLVERAITTARSLHQPLFAVTTHDDAVAVLTGAAP